MKASGLAPLLLLAALSSCGSTPRAQTTPGISEMWVTPWIQEAAANAAILREGTVYSHHFIADTAVLNDLGEHTVLVLAEHFAAHSGTVRVQKGATPDGLYAERVTTVLETLAAAGVPQEAVSFASTPPGGDGTYSDRVVVVVTAPTGVSTTATGDDTMSSTWASASEEQQ